MDSDAIREFLLWSKSAIIGGVAGLVGYLYLVVVRGIELRWPAFILYVLIASGLGLSIENAWPVDDATMKPWPGMGAVIALVGGSAFAVYGAIVDGMPVLAQRVVDWLATKLK